MTDIETELEQLLKLEDEHEEFKATVAEGRLQRFLDEHNRPSLWDVARIMREGVEPPRMALDDWLVEGELHWMFADAEAGKTWLALHLSLEIMRQGGVVVYFDEELGQSVIAERLLALEADPALIEARFVYAPFPSWQVMRADEVRRRIAAQNGTPLVDDPDLHRDFLKACRPTLVVYDTATDILSEADLDENSGVDVTKWVKTYPEEARKVGAAQLVLDHVGKSDKQTAVGSRAKRAKAKVQYKLARKKRFSTSEVGEIELTVMKNTRGADIPHERKFEIGGDPFALKETMNSRVTAQMILRSRIGTDLITEISKQPGVNKTNLFKAVTGKKETKDTVLRSLIDRGEVREENGDNGARRLFLGLK